MGRVAVIAVLCGHPLWGQAAGDLDSLRTQAEKARLGGDVSAAIRLYEEAEKADPQWPDGWWFLGILRYQRDEYGEARDALNRYIVLSPGAGPAIALRGLSEFELRDYDHALQDIERGLSLGAANQAKNTQILRLHEGMLLTLAGQFEKALESYGTAASAGALSPAMEVGAGLAGLRTRSLPADVAPHDQEMYALAGKAGLQWISGDNDAARASFARLFETYPKARNAHYLLGYLTFASDPESATAQFEKELGVAPDNSLARAMLSWAYLMREDPAAALVCARQAAQEDPSLHLAELVWGRSLVETGKPADGLKHLQRALEIRPDDLETHLALVRAYGSAGNSELASQERRRCLQLAKESAIARP